MKHHEIQDYLRHLSGRIKDPSVKETLAIIIQELDNMSQVAETLKKALTVIREMAQINAVQANQIETLEANQLDSTDQATLTDANTFLAQFDANGNPISGSGSASISGSQSQSDSGTTQVQQVTPVIGGS